MPEDHICTSQDESNFKFNHLKPDEKRMKHLLRSHQDIYASSSGEFGLISLAEHKIQTREATPIKQLPRRLPNALRLIVEEQVNEILEKKVIKPSNSPWSSPTVLVRKKDGKWRFCIDFRKLNDVTVKDAFLCLKLLTWLTHYLDTDIFQHSI